MNTAVQKTSITTNRDLYQLVTDTIIQQLENGTVPWQQPWQCGSSRAFSMPKNFTTGNTYRGINVLLLWVSAFAKDLSTNEWASFKQWKSKGESLRKDERGTMIVYYDTFEKEVDGETKNIPFLKSSIVFNRCQLASFKPETIEVPEQDLTTSIAQADMFVQNTKALIEHRVGNACYSPVADKISMPHREFFINSEACTATEGYYSTLLHELTHWTGHENRLGRLMHKKFADENYATEELVAELGTAFLCAKFDIAVIKKGDHANYIANWLKVLKDNKQSIFTAASAASHAVDFLHSLQPQ